MSYLTPSVVFGRKDEGFPAQRVPNKGEEGGSRRGFRTSRGVFPTELRILWQGRGCIGQTRELQAALYNNRWSLKLQHPLLALHQ